MQAVWKLALRCLLVFCAYVTTAGGVMSIRTGFPAPGLIGTFMFWFIGTKVVQALNKDKDDSWAWLIPQGEIERTLLIVGSVVGVIGGFAMKAPA